MSALPAALNSGQYSATGASMSSSPRCASRLAQAAVAPLVVENTSCEGVLGVGRARRRGRPRRPRGRPPCGRRRTSRSRRPPRRAPRSWRGRRRRRLEAGLDRPHRSPSHRPPRRVDTGWHAGRRRHTAGRLRPGPGRARRAPGPPPGRGGRRRTWPRRPRPWWRRPPCRGGSSATRPTTTASHPRATPTTMHTHTRRTSRAAVAGGPTRRPNTSRRAHGLERRDDGHRDERQQGEVGDAGAQAEAAGLGLVEGEDEEGAVAEHAADEHERGGHRLDPDVGPGRRRATSPKRRLCTSVVNERLLEMMITPRASIPTKSRPTPVSSPRRDRRFDEADAADHEGGGEQGADGQVEPPQDGQRHARGSPRGPGRRRGS